MPVIYTIGETVFDIIFELDQPVAAKAGGSLLNTSVSLGRLGLPVQFISEYGTDKVEIHKDSLSSGQRVLIIDDLVATGGTALAACNLIKKLGAEVVELAFIVDLPELGGRKKLESAGFKVYSQTEFEGE